MCFLLLCVQIKSVQTDHECRLECEAVSKSVLAKYQMKARLQNPFAIICYAHFVNVLNIQHTEVMHQDSTSII